MTDLKKMVDAEPAGAGAEFDALLPDADDATRQRIAEALAPQLVQHLADYPWLMQPATHLSISPRAAQEAFTETVLHLYNDAQLDVLGRSSILATRQRTTADPSR